MTAAQGPLPEEPGRARLRVVPGLGGRTDSGAEDAVAEGVGGEEFRRALAEHAAGVVVVTARPDGVPVGLTATSFTSVSLAPPLVSFYVAESSSTWPDLRRAAVFAVNVLGGHQADVAAHFARKGVDRFGHPTRWAPGPSGVPLIEGASARLVCRPYRIDAVGDHFLVVGLVVAAETAAAEAGIDEEHGERHGDMHSGVRPLLYHRGGFGRFLPS